VSELLPVTVHWAWEKSPFWRRRIEATGGAEPLAAFHALTPVVKADLAAAGEDLYAVGFERRRDRVVLTSGTRRRGAPALVLRRAPAELDALERSLRASNAAHEAAGLALRIATVVELWSVHHGLPEGAAPEGTWRVPWVPFGNFVDFALTALEDARREGGGRIDALRGSVSAVLTLVAAARERGLDLARFGVAVVGTNAYEATDRARRLIRAAFGCEVVIDNYSLSEFSTPAPECGACGAHHFGAPPLHAELFLEGPEPLPGEAAPRALRATPWEAGAEGRLVLTGLFPFVQRTPLLRYDTGDLVRTTGYCEAAQALGFQPTGRAVDALRAPPSEEGSPRAILVAPADLFRVVDELPDVARAPHLVERNRVVAPSDLGPPLARARLEERPPGAPISVLVEVAGRPRLSPAAREGLARDVRRGLLGRSAALARLAEGREDALRVEVVPPEAIPDDMFKA